MVIEITGVDITKSANHLGMTVGLPTINYYQSRVPFSGVVNTNMNITPTADSVDQKFNDKWDDPRYYSGDATT